MRKYTTEEIIEQFMVVHGYKYIYDKVEYVNAKTKVLIGCKVEGHGYFEQETSSHKCGNGCPKCGGRLTLTVEYVKEKLKEINPNIIILSDNYTNNNTKLKCKCLIDNHEWDVKWSNLQQGRGCPMCDGKMLHDKNRLSLVRTDLVKYFVNPKDADSYTVSSNKKVQLKCPECGHIKNMILCNLAKQGFGCHKCSDGISIPEKFGIYLFKQLDIKIELQYSPNWANCKRYDFYIPSLNMIIETHGLQHYKQTTRNNKRVRTLQEEQENDNLKYNLAMNNGIKPENYIVVDCRISEFDWLKENYIKQLECVFNLSNIDWFKVLEDSQLSLLIQVCNAWNNSVGSVKDLSNVFNVSDVTIRKYLKIGAKLNKCIYNPKDEINKKRRKITYQYSLDDNFIREWNSNAEIERILNIFNTSISACCNKKLKTSGGFKWSYNPPNENGMYPD